MEKGFTLPELLITMIVVGVLAAASIPSFTAIHDRFLMDRMASRSLQLYGIAKSYAVTRQQDIYVHIIGLSATPSQTDSWCLVVSTQSAVGSCGDTDILAIVEGETIGGLTLSRPDNATPLKVASLNGWPDTNGNAQQTLLSFHRTEGKAINLKANIVGRFWLCRLDEDQYGYSACA